MVQFFKNLSIKTKLTLVIMLSSAVLLVVISSVLLIVEIYATRTTLVQETRILANSLAVNSRQPLMLGKFSEIEALLSSLTLQKNIHAAYLFNLHGKPVAEYLTQADSKFVFRAIRNDFNEQNKSYWTSLTSEKLLMSLEHFGLFTPVFFEDKYIGTLYLLSDLDSLYGRLSGVAFGITLSLLLLIFCSWLLAGHLQKPVSAPLLQLADLMGDVSRFNDYSIRAEKVSGDEIGTLVDGFNRMLKQIELHQASLAKHQLHLEQTVAERTRELRAAVTALERSRQQADAANEAKSHFLSRMTHELRTPLIGVLGMNELMLRTSLSDQQKMLVGTVQKSGKELLHLISDVLDFSRIEAGKLLLEFTEVDLYHVFEDVVELLSPAAREKGLSLLAEIPLDVTWKVRADETRIRQILMNLVGNAIKFTSSGSVTVSLNCTQQSAGSGTFVFEVTDTGMGMDEAVKCRVFDVFYQIDGAGAKVKSGAGLGLAIVKQLVDLMKGKLSLISIPDRGSKFQVIVKLPLVEKTEFVLPAGLKGRRVLLCIDDKATGRILQRRLDELLFRVEVAPTAAEALYQLNAAKSERDPYALLFLSKDICLPDGRHFFKALRTDTELQSLRTVLLLSDRSESIHMSGSEVRLYTPVNWSELYNALHRSWQDLHLISGTLAKSDSAGQESSVKKSKILLVGSHVASRELFRLSLEKWPVSIDIAGNISELQNCKTVYKYAAVFFDFPYLSSEELLSFLQNKNKKFPDCFLLCDKQPADLWQSCVDNYLIKPVSDEKLAVVLHPLLAAQSTLQLHEGDNR